MFTVVKNVVTHSVQVAMWIHIPGLAKQKPFICLILAQSERNALLIPAVRYREVCSYCLSCQWKACPCVCGMVNQWESESICVESEWSLLCHGQYVIRLMAG